MGKQIDVQDSVQLVPSGYDSSNSSYSSVSSSYPISNGYDGSDSTSYAYITCNTGSRATTYISYTFNTSSIPQEATIDSVTCSAKARVSSTSYISTAVLQLYADSTAKGSSTSARTTSATVYNLTPGSWTRSEISNIQIRYTGTRGTSSTSRAAYLYFYGATLTINYSISGMQYTLTATSEVSGVTIDPLAVNVMEGEDQEFTFDFGTNDPFDLKVEDNDTDITGDLVEHTVSGGTLERYPAEYATSGSISGTNYRNAIGESADVANTSGNDYCSSSGSTAHIDYSFDFSDIPENAIIESVSVRVKGHCESTSSSSEVATLRLYSGSTAKGSESEFTSTADSVITMTTGTWTREELQNAILRFTIGYYGGRVSGATWTVVYDVESTTYYTYTLSNIQDDHNIVVSLAGAYVPPEEDPTKTYYPITISSINADTDPNNGTTRVESGTSQVVTITPTDPQLTLALDNGVDITSQLVGGVPENTYTVTTQVSGASYGFNLNSSTGYYVSTNNGVSKSASVARLNMNFESDCLVTITYINYAEEDYDYGMFGKLDTEVATDGLTASSGGSSPSDSTSNYQLARCSNSTSTQTITYQVPMGEHFIDIKYGKDDASDSGNDSLQWKVTSIEATSAGGDYTYTLNNINQKHSLIFIFGNVSYYFVTSSIASSNARLFPDGQMVALEGDSYQLIIVPNDANATVTLTDNNVDVTSSLTYEEGQDKSGNKVVNYKYELHNITAAHTLNVTCSSAAGSKLYRKVNGQWVLVTKVYVKRNGAWAETSFDTAFTTGVNYRKGN